MPRHRRLVKEQLLKRARHAFELLIPDTSVIIEGLLSTRLARGEWTAKAVMVHEAVMAELEAQANRRKEIGYQGLEEIKRLRQLCAKKNIAYSFSGSRPTDFEIKYARVGEIDALIRDLAAQEKGTLVTADVVQSLVAESKGIKVLLVEIKEQEIPIPLAKYFDEHTMSVHLREECAPRAKRGRPGRWEIFELGKDALPREAVQELAQAVIKAAKGRPDGFIEYDRRGSTIVQLANYRIVIARPPFADGYEITAVRPIVHLALKQYALSEKLRARLDGTAEGLLVAGPPGHGKSTFASALAEHYSAKGRIVKSIEAPRDLTLGPHITQYALSHGSPQEVADLLLLTRPDYTIFDEMRTTEDFHLYADLRLSGVGMVGVIHATTPIDAIQRFIGRIELGVIPHIIDSVLFVKDGAIAKAYSVSLQVKVPSGMFEADLARPVVVVHDFECGRLEFEIYSYGEETVVVPVTIAKASPVHELAAKALVEQIKGLVRDAQVEMIADNRAVIFVPPGQRPALIGKDGATIDAFEKKMGMHLDVRERDMKAAPSSNKSGVPFEVKVEPKYIVLAVGASHAEHLLDILVNDDILLSAKASKKGIIKVARYHKIGKLLADAIHAGERIEVKG